MSTDRKEELIRLLDARESLRTALLRNEHILSSISVERKVNVLDLIQFADFVTDTFSAPEGWRPDKGMPLHGSVPPAPMPDQMRRGKLGELEVAKNAQSTQIAPPTPQRQGQGVEGAVEALKQEEIVPVQQVEQVVVKSEDREPRADTNKKRPRESTPPPPLSLSLLPILLVL